MDHERASWLVAKAGLSHLVLASPESVYHARGNFPGISRLGIRDKDLVVIAADPKTPLRSLSLAFAHYYTTADIGTLPDTEQYLVTWPGADGAPLPAPLWSLRDAEPMPAREARRRAAVAGQPVFASMEKALAAALSPGPHGAIGYDTAGVAALLQAAAPGARHLWSADLARHLRLVKTPQEIRLMREASAANVAAALSVAADMARLGTLQAVRNAFNARASTLGNTPVFMAVDGVITPEYEAPLTPNRATLIDCVSQRAGYHGDFGRTVFLGDPPAAAKAAAKAAAAAWAALAAELRPGLTFSQISARGTALLRAMDGGAGLHIPFGPHSVGLAHTEQPEKSLDGHPLDITLEPGMIISVDCPLMEAGNWGTLHLEDLTLITTDGATPIHATGEPILVA